MEDDPRYTGPRAAAYTGVQPGTWRSAVSRGQAPQPDGVDEFSGLAYWLQSTLDRHLDGRLGRGAPGVKRGPRKRTAE